MNSSVSLQDAIYNVLIADASVNSLVGARIYDNPPAEPRYPYVSFGPSQTISEYVDCLNAEEQFFQVDVWTQDGGSKRGAKEICGAVKKALHLEEVGLADTFALVTIRVESIRVIDDPDDQIAHGVVSVTAYTEDHG